MYNFSRFEHCQLVLIQLIHVTKCGFGDIHSPRTDGHDPLDSGTVLHDCTLVQTVNVNMFIVLLQVVIHAFLSPLLSVARRQMIIQVDVRPSELTPSLHQLGLPVARHRLYDDRLRTILPTRQVMDGRNFNHVDIHVEFCFRDVHTILSHHRRLVYVEFFNVLLSVLLSWLLGPSCIFYPSVCA